MANCYDRINKICMKQSYNNYLVLPLCVSNSQRFCCMCVCCICCQCQGSRWKNHLSLICDPILQCVATCFFKGMLRLFLKEISPETLRYAIFHCVAFAQVSLSRCFHCDKEHKLKGVERLGGHLYLKAFYINWRIFCLRTRVKFNAKSISVQGFPSWLSLLKNS